MNPAFELTPRAAEDIDDIWWFIAAHSPAAADRVEAEIVATCRRLARNPRIGRLRPDITQLEVRFWPVTRYSDYIVVYRPEIVPLQVVAVLHGKRDLTTVLRSRL